LTCNAARSPKFHATTPERFIASRGAIEATMLFNSAQFLFLFLPITVTGYILLQAKSSSASIWWLLAASLTFYSAWNIAFLPILCGSMVANYGVSVWICRTKHRRAILSVGIAANLGLLIYFKYAGFLAETAGMSWEALALPLGISFFTFQQISHLVDVYRSEVGGTDFARYALFVSFFPHLIAGPLTHHDEVAPQFGRARADRLQDISVGGTLLVLGLIKKMIIADAMALPASAAFDAAASGTILSAGDAWLGAICYALQLYFDFSAYSDMAIGVARMMGVDFPINFASPYKAHSISDFWRRWHISLSRFLRDYLYIPLGGSRTGPARHQLNLMITMVLGGMWHGAGWTFVLWGAMHGAYLLLHHAWRSSVIGRLVQKLPGWPGLAWALTILAVVLAWVPFRAPDLATTLSIWGSMMGLGGDAALPGVSQYAFQVVVFSSAALFAPNAYEWLAAYRVGLPSRGYPATQGLVTTALSAFLWRPVHAVLGGLAIATVVLKLYDVSAFIYFQF